MFRSESITSQQPTTTSAHRQSFFYKNFCRILIVRLFQMLEKIHRFGSDQLDACIHDQKPKTNGSFDQKQKFKGVLIFNLESQNW